jgi:GT2 family glycosyltransferase
MNLSIIIVNWNTRDLLAKSLEAVYKTIHSCEYEVFVVDNGSTDGSHQMVREKYPEVLLIENQKNLGFAKANNQAIQQCKGKYVLLLNSDAFLSNGAVDQMMELAESNCQIGIIGACLVYQDGQLQISHGQLPSFFSEFKSLVGYDKLHKLFRKSDQSSASFETGFVSGACMLVRQSTLQQIGLLDESFFFFSEEIDLCYRAQKAGWKVFYSPSALVMHLEGGTSGMNANRILLLYRGKLRYFEKHYGVPAKQKLLKTMQIITMVKVWTYSMLRWITLGHIKKDQFWRTVAVSLLSEI